MIINNARYNGVDPFKDVVDMSDDKDGNESGPNKE